MTAARTSTELPRSRLRVRATALRLPGLVISILLVAVALQHAVAAGVLEQDDLTRIARMNTLFLEVLTDVSQSAQRTDLASGDSECVRSTLRALTQIAEELRSYSYLMTIEGELTDFGDDHTLRGVVRFAVENALRFLDGERRRMGELWEQCARFPLSAGKTRQAVQLIDGITATLRSVQPRL
jgi:hypothetical protein